MYLINTNTILESVHKKNNEINISPDVISNFENGNDNDTSANYRYLRIIIIIRQEYITL